MEDAGNRVINTSIFIVKCELVSASLCSCDKELIHVIVVEVQGVLKEWVNILKRGFGVNFKDSRLLFKQPFYRIHTLTYCETLQHHSLEYR